MGAPIVEPVAPRMLPPVTDRTRAYWTGGAHGHLLIDRCQECGRWALPTAARTECCGGERLPEAVSGRGTVFTFTVNMHQFHPDVPPPNVIAIVVLDEQDDLRLATNIVGAETAELRCGLPVSVAFERHGEMFYPVFEPVRGDGDG
jgi:uncharacterized OB-fold protein